MIHIITANMLAFGELNIPTQQLEAVTSGTKGDWFVTVRDANGEIVGQTPVGGLLFMEAL